MIQLHFFNTKQPFLAQNCHSWENEELERVRPEKDRENKEGKRNWQREIKIIKKPTLPFVRRSQWSVVRLARERASRRLTFSRVQGPLTRIKRVRFEQEKGKECRMKGWKNKCKVQGKEGGGKESKRIIRKNNHTLEKTQSEETANRSKTFLASTLGWF